MMLKILVFFVTISSHCSNADSSLESQKHFKKMKDYGKHAWMHACIYVLKLQIYQTNKILYLLRENYTLGLKHLFKLFIYKLTY